MRSLRNIFRLGLKEVWSLLRDPVLMALVAYTFTAAVYAVAHGVRTEVRNAAIAVVDEDRSTVSNRIRGAFLPPYFKPAALIGIEEIGPAMDRGRYSFVLHIPAGSRPTCWPGASPCCN